MKYIVFISILIFIMGCSKNGNTNNDKNRKKLEQTNKKMSKKSDKTDSFKKYKAPDFTLKTTTGEEITLSKLKGKVVLLDFWGTWCPPCKKMIPVLSSFVDKCSSEGVELLGIHSSANFPGVEKVDFFAGEMGVNYPMLIGTKENEINYKVKAFPTLLIIDREGYVRNKFMGYHSLTEIRKAVRKELDRGKK